MPFLYKHTLIFEGLGHGFTESLYFERPTDDLDAAVTWVDPLKDARRKLLGKQHYIKGQRVGLIRTDAGVKVLRKTAVQKFYLPGTQAQPSEETGMSLQVLWSNGARDRKKLMFMGGPWRAIFPEGDTLDIEQGAFTTFFNSWVSTCKTLKMGWLHTNLEQARKIVGYEFDPVTGHTTYTLEAPGITWPNTDDPIRVSVEFPLSKNPLDGVQLVIPVSPTVAETAGPRPASPFTVKGVMRLSGFTFIDVSSPNGQGVAGSIVAQNPVSRKRGRPLLVSRGRSPNRPRW